VKFSDYVYCEKLRFIHFAQRTSVKTNKMVTSRKIDIIWKLYA